MVSDEVLPKVTIDPTPLEARPLKRKSKEVAAVVALETTPLAAALIGPVRLIFPPLPLNPPFTPVLPELSNTKVGVERFTESRTIPLAALIEI
jgi:hypothetical protein